MRAYRWHIETPSIIEGSVLIMSRTGVGLAMFSMGKLASKKLLKRINEITRMHARYKLVLHNP